MSIRRRALAAAATLGMVVAGAVAASPANADLPVPYNSAAALAASLQNPNANPPGSNDFDCRPTVAHPRPVVLVSGTFANRVINWNTASPLLKNEGYCVFALNYGATKLTDLSFGQIRSVAAVRESAVELRDFVDQVLSATGADKVDIVGHSQGGMMPRWYLKFLGGAAKVDTLVGLAPSNHGTTLWGLGLLASWFPQIGQPLVGAFCPACADQVVDSPAMRELNGGGDTQPGVKYTVISTIYDQVVQPYRSQFLSGPNTTNITLQNGCLINFADHLSPAFDRRALRFMLNALDPAHAKRAPCLLSLPVLGG